MSRQDYPPANFSVTMPKGSSASLRGSGYMRQPQHHGLTGEVVKEMGGKMKGKVKSSPAPQKSASSVVGMAIMLICSIVFTVYAGGILRENETSFAMSGIFYLFMAAWIATALYLVIYHARKLKRP